MLAGEALQAARARLAAVSQNARLDAELLLAGVLGVPRTTLFAHPEQILSPEEIARFEHLLARRLAAEPMQYITGVQEFFGLPFEVSPAVLIPRPETEHLVEAVLALQAGPLIADVGTGSGAIAVALARNLPGAHVTAIDNSAAALEVARRNANRHGVSGQIDFLLSDLLELSQQGSLDAVVSNPPYIAEDEVLEPQVRDYEPYSALFAGPTGLEVYRRLIPQAARALRYGGWLLLEIGHGQQPDLERLLAGWHDVRFIEDLQGIPRVVAARILQ